MGFFSALSTAWALGNEYTGAWQAGARAVEDGGGVLDGLRAFADHTGNRLDDEAVEVLAKGITAAIDYSLIAGMVAMRAGLWLENHGPRIIATASRLAAVAGRVAGRLEALR